MGIYNANVRRSNFSAAAGNVNATSAQVQQLAQRLANDIIRQRDLAAQRARLGRIYTTFKFPDDALENQVETVTKGLFAGNTGSLVNMFTSSLLTATQKSYYQEIFSVADPGNTTNGNSELSLAYGHYAGSGSKDTTGNLNNDTPSRAIYKQYAQVLLAPNDKFFTINSVNTDHIYALNFNRARFREKLDPGNFEVTLAELCGSNNSVAVTTGNYLNNSGTDGNFHTGSNVRLSGTGAHIQIIDDSSVTSATVGEAGLVYNLVSGSIDEGTSIYRGNDGTADPTYFGLLYPQHGIAILNATQLDKSGSIGGANFGSVTGSGVQGDNATKLFFSVSHSNAITNAGVNGGLQARSAEQVKSTYYFVRVLNGEYNYSNNPSYVTGSLGQLAFSTFVNDPQSYISTVGMYNDRKELLATAKLSQPLLKNYTREALIKVKLDF